MISIIIPVYNVARYLDRCMDSVVNQTYEDWEAILVDNNSDASTLKKEEEWLKKDERIRRCFQPEQGSWPARNKGIEEAEGEYIAFLDSDDWWDLTILEKLYKRLIEENCDVTTCNQVHCWFDESDKLIRRMRYQNLVLFDDSKNISDNLAFMELIEPSLCAKLYRRDVFAKNGLMLPNCMAEDRVFISLFSTKFQKLGRVQEDLYYYHAERSGSNVNSLKSYREVPEAINLLVDGFINDGTYDRYQNSIRSLCFRIVENSLDYIKNCEGKVLSGELSEIKGEILSTYKKYFPDNFERLYVIGGHALRREVYYAYHDDTEKRLHAQYSSIISLMSEPSEYDFTGFSIENKQQEGWLRMDLCKDFKKLDRVDGGDYFFIDFMEERFDIGRQGDFCFTLSELFTESSLKDSFFYERLKRTDESTNELWFKKCNEFIGWLIGLVSPEHIVLVRNKLCERHGFHEGTTLFLNQEEIRRTNEMLDRYYDYFIVNCPGVHVVDPERFGHSFFSHEEYRYGCAPYNMNETYYINVANVIREIIL